MSPPAVWKTAAGRYFRLYFPLMFVTAGELIRYWSHNYIMMAARIILPSFIINLIFDSPLLFFTVGELIRRVGYCFIGIITTAGIYNFNIFFIKPFGDLLVA